MAARASHSVRGISVTCWQISGEGTGEAAGAEVAVGVSVMSANVGTGLCGGTGVAAGLGAVAVAVGRSVARGICSAPADSTVAKAGDSIVQPARKPQTRSSKISRLVVNTSGILTELAAKESVDLRSDLLGPCQCWDVAGAGQDGQPGVGDRLRQVAGGGHGYDGVRIAMDDQGGLADGW